jgi:hypothetical protein
MAKYKFKYAIVKGDETLFESEAEVSLTKQNFADMEEFIIEHDYSPELVDIPAGIYDKMSRVAFEKALSEYKAFADPANGYELAFEMYIPESFLAMLSEDTQNKIYGNIPEEDKE